MWVRLRSIQRVAEKGREVQHFPGEWVDVGKQVALSWIAAGLADRPDQPDLKALPGCGVLLTGLPAFSLAGMDLVRGRTADGQLPFARTLIGQGHQFRADLIAEGFSLLDSWEVAAPLHDYAKLARDFGGEEELALTEEVIRDLRVPVYDVRLMFVRRCRATRELMRVWEEEREKGDSLDLSFLRALYLVKPLVLALPCTWSLG